MALDRHKTLDTRHKTAPYNMPKEALPVPNNGYECKCNLCGFAALRDNNTYCEYCEPLLCDSAPLRENKQLAKRSAAYYLPGTTLLESLTALAIITTVVGLAFTLYTKTMNHQNQVAKSKAILIQNEFEHGLNNDSIPNELISEGLDITIEQQQWNTNKTLNQYTLTIKAGNKTILQKNYLKRKKQSDQ